MSIRLDAVAPDEMSLVVHVVTDYRSKFMYYVRFITSILILHIIIINLYLTAWFTAVAVTFLQLIIHHLKNSVKSSTKYYHVAPCYTAKYHAYSFRSLFREIQ